jgi:hypothetical protein
MKTYRQTLAYSTPTLNCYGSVSQLTLSGTGSRPEQEQPGAAPSLMDCPAPASARMPGIGTC